MIRRYREIFFAHHGPGPYACVFCTERVCFEVVVVHHHDHDRANLRPENLVPAHDPCHRSYHHGGRQKSPETRARMSAAQKVLYANSSHEALLSAPKGWTAEARAAVGERNRNRPVSVETRARMSAAQIKRHARERP